MSCNNRVQIAMHNRELEKCVVTLSSAIRRQQKGKMFLFFSFPPPCYCFPVAVAAELCKASRAAAAAAKPTTATVAEILYIRVFRGVL